MNENKRTVAYLVVAVLAVVIAWEPWTRRAASTTQSEKTGKLFEDFDDPTAATSMRILKYDEETGALHPFQVAQVDGLWSIPSHQNYPADAREHLAEAATAISNLEILSVAGTKPGEHEQFGVLDPDAKDLSAGATGVGTRVTMKGAGDKVLADLIIGKEVKDTPQQRYVREPSRDQVYMVAVKTDKLSTRFGDWIEKDLLKLNAFDVSGVQLNDYSIAIEGNHISQDNRGEIILEYEDPKGDAKTAWKLKGIVEYEDGKPVPHELQDDEELNTEKLNALKTALDDLQIVDVERKPKGLKGLQFISDVAADRQSIISLAERGFFPARDRDNNMGIYSKEGEAICRMKDGVEYVLRFGDIAGGDSNQGDGEKSDGEKSDGEKGKDSVSKVNRYLFVMTQFNPDLIAKPDLAPLPGDDQADGEQAAATATKKDGKNDADADQKDAADKSDAEKTADQQAVEEDEAERKKVQAEKRAEVEKENKRKQDEYDEKVKKGKDHVKELNTRFADWYYIISDDTYHKIHLDRADVVKAQEKKTGDADASDDDLKKLEKAGLRK